MRYAPFWLRSRLPTWLMLALYVPAYLGALGMGYGFYFADQHVSALWPASGVAVGTLILMPLRIWPLFVLLTTASDHLAAWYFDSWSDMAGVFEALVGATAFRAIVHRFPELDRFRILLLLTFACAMIGPAVGALIGARSVALMNLDIDYWAAFQVWWMSDGLGVLVFAPAILAWGSPRIMHFDIDQWRPAEAVVFLVVFVLIGYAVLGAPAAPHKQFNNFSFVFLPLLIFAAMRYDLRTVSLATGVLAVLVVGCAADGRGPFVVVLDGASNVRVLYIQAFLAILIWAALLLHGALVERSRDARRRLDDIERTLRMERIDAIARVAAAAAHDFNNDLAVIVGSAGELREEPALSPSVMELVDEISEAADHSAGLVREMLSLAPRRNDTRALCDVSAVVAEQIPVIARLLGAGIACRSDITDELWGTIEASELRRILVNLACNARDAMTGGGSLTIEVTDDAEHVVVSVTDTGEGMPPEIKARVLEPFFTTKGDDGTGLGLATAHRAIQQAGGTLSIDSAVGEGTRISIRLPRTTRPA